MANVVKKTAKDMEKLDCSEKIYVEKQEDNEVKASSNDNSRIAQLEAQIELLTKMLMTQKNVPAVNPTSRKLDDEVTVVHLIQRDVGLKTHIQLSNMTIDFRSFGEERILPLMVFEELVGKYRSWFDKGILAPGPDAGDVARRYGLKVSTQFGITKELVDKIPEMSLLELEDLYEKVGEGHRKFILEQFRRGVAQNNPKYKDIHKLEMLNRISDGALSSTLLDIRIEKERASMQKK